MNRFVILIILLQLTDQCFGQLKNCFEKDSNKCYIYEKFESKELAIEKKLESNDTVYTMQIVLLADMDGDCIPEFIVINGDANQILIIDSKSGITKWKFNTPYIDLSLTGLAIGDVDYDGIPEIFLEAGSYSPNPSNIFGKLFCYHANGDLMWISDHRVDLYTQFNEQYGGTPTLADFNQDGIPEIYVNNKIFNAQNGIMLVDGGGYGIGSGRTKNVSVDCLSIAAQLDEEPTDLELAAGYTVYKVKITNLNGMAGNSMIPKNIQVDNLFRDGFTTVADVNLDGKLDIIVTSPGLNDALVYVYNFINDTLQLLAKAYAPIGLNLSYEIGPPLAGDINGLGKPSIVFTRANRILEYSFVNSNVLQLDWTLITTDPSGTSGLSMFDLNNDGTQELVFRDENYLNIINIFGNIPKIIDSIKCPSYTYCEYPIIGDIQNLGQASICIPCGMNNVSSGNSGLGKLTVFGPPDSLPGWAPARGIWNQYNYHVLNINDDLTVPRVEKNNATYKNGKYNNFYVQESLLDENGMYKKPAASFLGDIQCINYNPATDQYTVIFDLYNKSNASMDADSALQVSFYNGDPETLGILIDVYFTKLKLRAGDSLMNQSFTFSASNLNRLFMVINTHRDTSGVFDPKDYIIPECDYTDNLVQAFDLPKILMSDTTLCKGADYKFYDTILHDSGTYYHKLFKTNACDSLIAILHLSLTDTVHINQFLTVCDAYNWNGNKYTATGDYVYDTLNAVGCDSITTLHLMVHPSSQSVSDVNVCNQYSWNGQTYTSSGKYLFQTLNAEGCDSTATLNIVIHNSDTTNITKAACDNYNWNGVNYTKSGNYSYNTQNTAGCDSIVNLFLTIDTVIHNNITQTACGKFTWVNQTFTTSGIYSFDTISAAGCDSITTLDLSINPMSSSTTQITSCDSYLWNGINYTASGTYIYKTQNAFGCDSIATLDLIVHPTTNSMTNASSCDSYTWNGQTYTTSGNYSYKTQNTFGCDSTALLNLIIHNADTVKINQTSCDTFNWNQQTYFQSGNYQYHAIGTSGCDSLTILNLIVNKSSSVNLNLTACDSLDFLGKKLLNSGNYLFTIQNAAGCDSTITVDFTRLSTNQSTQATSCDTFIWNVNNQIYNQSGIYTANFLNSSGCDSTFTLDLNLNKSFQFVQQAEVCNEYIWPVNQLHYTKSGSYDFPLKTMEGCDSIYKLNLVVNPDYSQSDTVITNDDFTWKVNNQTYSVSGTYQKQFISSSGCDSTHFLVLIINKDIEIYFPNVINTNGLNNKFTLFVYGSDAIIESLSIYDRWGELIWQKQHFVPNDLQLGWDGKFKDQYVLPGVYVWHASISTKKGELIRKKGDLTVVR